MEQNYGIAWNSCKEKAGRIQGLAIIVRAANPGSGTEYISYETTHAVQPAIASTDHGWLDRAQTRLCLDSTIKSTHSIYELEFVHLLHRLTRGTNQMSLSALFIPSPTRAAKI